MVPLLLIRIKMQIKIILQRMIQILTANVMDDTIVIIITFTKNSNLLDND